MLRNYYRRIDNLSGGYHNDGREKIMENLQKYMDNDRSDASCIKYWSQRNPIKDGVIKYHPKYKIYVEKL